MNCWSILLRNESGWKRGTHDLLEDNSTPPVEDLDPIARFHAAVTRKPADGRLLHPDQRRSRQAALKAYAIHNAFAAFRADPSDRSASTFQSELQTSAGELGEIDLLDQRG
jgi:hypothetical protein